MPKQGRNEVSDKVRAALALMAEAGIELFQMWDVASWAGVPPNSTVSAELAKLAKQHNIIVTRYSELNGHKGKIFMFNETYYNSNMRKGAR